MAFKGGKKDSKGMKGRQTNPMMELHRIQMNFHQEAEMLYHCVVDLNQTKGMLENQWKHLLTLRDQLVKSLSPSPGKGKGGGCKGVVNAFAALPAPTSFTQEDKTDWKGTLLNEYGKVTKLQGPALKEHLAFDVQEVEAVGQQRGYWLAQLTVDDQAFQGEEMPSKKAAEKSVCKIALECLFPEAFAKLMGGLQAEFAPAVGQKRGAAAMEPATEEAPKSRLAYAVGLMLQRPMMKGDLTFDTQEVELEEPSNNGRPLSWQCSLTIVDVDPNSSFVGEVCSNKKLAENSACAAALEALADQIEPLEQEHKAKKARASKEKLEAFKERRMKQSEGLLQVKPEKRF